MATASAADRARGSDTSATNAASPAPLETVSYADTVAKALPAVVTVEVEKRADRTANQEVPEEFFRRFFGPQTPQRGGRAPLREGVGSGVIVTGDGTILTNNHVVEDAEHITVRLHDGRTYTARVVGTDAPTDLAVIDIEANNLPTLPLADSGRVRVGDVVLAVGNPAEPRPDGHDGHHQRQGPNHRRAERCRIRTFSRPMRRSTRAIRAARSSRRLASWSASTRRSSRSRAATWASGSPIPSNLAKNVMSQLVSTGKVRRSMLGVTVQPVTSDLADGLGLSAVRGAVVSDVSPGSPAEKAGLGAADVILRVDGVDVSDSNDLRNRISNVVPGQTVTVDYMRDGKPRSARIQSDRTHHRRSGRRPTRGEARPTASSA